MDRNFEKSILIIKLHSKYMKINISMREKEIFF